MKEGVCVSVFMVARGWVIECIRELERVCERVPYTLREGL